MTHKTRLPSKHLRGQNERRQLANDLPSLPEQVAMEADTYLLTILAAVWLDTDDRIDERTNANPI